jgi:acyl dehydratase
MVRLGDVVTCRGQVKEVRERGGRPLAVCEVEAVNQEGAVVTQGVAEAWMD